MWQPYIESVTALSDCEDHVGEAQQTSQFIFMRNNIFYFFPHLRQLVQALAMEDS